MTLRIVPLTLKQANALVATLHRHHKPVVGHRFSIGCRAFDSLFDEDRLCGAAIIGRPVSREINQYDVAEVSRLVTDGTKHACSKLYAAAARACREMGFQHIQTYVLEDEPATTLIAAGWTFDGLTEGGDWNTPSREGRRTDQPQVKKQRWIKRF